MLGRRRRVFLTSVLVIRFEQDFLLQFPILGSFRMSFFEFLFPLPLLLEKLPGLSYHQEENPHRHEEER